MFGNLFNQKKSDATTEAQVVGAQVSVGATTDSFFGNPTPAVTETINVTAAPAAPVAPAPAVPPVATDAAQAMSAPVTPVVPTDTAGNLTSNPTARENVTALSRLDPRSTQVLRHAEEIAKKNGQQEIKTDHILYGLVFDGEIFKLLESFNVDAAKISAEIESKQVKGTFNGQPTLSAAGKQILEESYNTAKLRGASFVSPEDIMLAVFPGPSC